jgi:hypothetical protein
MNSYYGKAILNERYKLNERYQAREKFYGSRLLAKEGKPLPASGIYYFFNKKYDNYYS